jgi:hypothetical protein
MKTIYRFILILLLLNVPNLQAQLQVEDMSDLKIGDIVDVWNPSAKVNARIYFFTDAGACHVCNLAISNIAKYLINKHKIEFVGFLNRADNEMIEFTKKQFEWNFDVVSDWLGIYMAHYKVKALPFYIVTDYKGKVLAYDRAGGQKYNPKQLDSIITFDRDYKENIGFKVGTNKFMREIKRVRLKHQDGRNLGGDHNINALINDKTGDLYLRTNFRCDIYVLDTNGKMKYEISDTYYKDWDCDFPYQMSWFEKDSIMCIYNLKSPGRILLLFDVINQNILSTNVFSEFIDTSEAKIMNYQSGISGINIGNTDNFLTYTSYTKRVQKQYLTNDDKICAVLDYDGNVIKRFGKVEPIFGKYKAIDWFEIKYIYSFPNIYALQTFPNSLQKYDMEFNLVNSVKLKLGSAYKMLNEDINTPNSKEADFFPQLTSRISYLYNYPIYDEKNDIFLFNYINYFYPIGVTNHLSREVKKDFYMHVTNTDGVPYFPDDIFMQNMGQPIHIKGNKLWVIEIENSKLDLVIYELDIKLKSDISN